MKTLEEENKKLREEILVLKNLHRRALYQVWYDAKDGHKSCEETCDSAQNWLKENEINCLRYLENNGRNAVKFAEFLHSKCTKYPLHNYKKVWALNSNEEPKTTQELYDIFEQSNKEE